MAVDVAPDNTFSQPVGGDVCGGGIAGANPCGVVLEGLPEPGHVLAQFAHDHVATVETKVEEAFRRSLRPQLGCARWPIVRHQRAWRLFGVRVGMTQQDFAQRYAMPWIA